MTIEALEKRVETLEAEMQSIGELIQLDRRLMESRFAAIFAEFDLLKRRMDEMPSAMARTLVELLDERDKRGS